MEEIIFRQAEGKDKHIIWEILQQAIERRKMTEAISGRTVIQIYKLLKMTLKRTGYVLILNDEVITYAALIFNDEPAYEAIQGQMALQMETLWLFTESRSFRKSSRKGYCKKLFGMLEDFAKSHQVYSIKVDTNFDNLAMLAILEKNGIHILWRSYFP